MKLVDLDSEVYQGTPVQIVSKMRNVYNRFNANRAITNEEFMLVYIELFKFLKDPITCDGNTQEEKCISFIKSLLKSGQAKEIAS